LIDDFDLFRSKNKVFTGLQSEYKFPYQKKIPPAKICGKSKCTSYTKVCGFLSDIFFRLQARTEHSNHDVLRVEFSEDLFLPLYRHWTIHESLTHALPVASAVKVWTGAGSRKIKELVAQIGMPLTQANEQYHYMEQK